MHPSVRPRRALLGVLLASWAVGACAASDGGSVLPPETSTPVSAPLADDPRQSAVLRLEFSGTEQDLVGGAIVEDSSGHGHFAVVQTSEPDAPLQQIAGPDGEPGALQFPDRCDAAGGRLCPRVVLEVADAPDLNPGSRDFAWGAVVQLTPEQTSDGSNVVQKGFSNGGGSQWKLQVDGAAGRPSCVVVGRESDEVHRVVAPDSIADGTWHEVICRRDGAELSVTVDGEVGAREPLPADLDVRPAGPVRIAGKNAKQNNDQYFGAVADVYVAVAPS